MFIKRSKYDALVDENLKLRERNAFLESNKANLETIMKAKNGSIAEKVDTITFLKNRVEILEASEQTLTAQNIALSNKLHKKDQPRTSGGKFGKK